MKIAYCLTGLIDNPDLTLEGLEELKEAFDMDIFIHTWEHEQNPGFHKLDIFKDIATKITTSTYDEAHEAFNKYPEAREMYDVRGENIDFKYFIRVHLAQFYSTVQCAKLAYEHGDYPFFLKARSNLRFNVVANKDNWEEFKHHVQNILDRNLTHWRGIEPVLANEDREVKLLPIDEMLAKKMPGYGTLAVFVPDVNFPIWRWETAFHDSLFGMENLFVKKNVLKENWLQDVMKEFVNHTKTCLMPYSAEKIWYNYMMNNNIAIFSMPIQHQTVRERTQRIVIQ